MPDILPDLFGTRRARDDTGHDRMGQDKLKGCSRQCNIMFPADPNDIANLTDHVCSGICVVIFGLVDGPGRQHAGSERRAYHDTNTAVLRIPENLQEALTDPAVYKASRSAGNPHQGPWPSVRSCLLYLHLP